MSVRMHPHVVLSALWLGLSWSAMVLAKEEVLMDRLEASVNSSIILISDIEECKRVLPLRIQLDPLLAGTELALQAAQMSSGQLKAQEADSLREKILKFLMQERLILQKFPKNDSEVTEEIQSIERNNHLERSALIEALKREGYLFSEYFEVIRASLSKRALIDFEIRPKVGIPSDIDIKNEYYNRVIKTTTLPRSFHLAIISVATESYHGDAKVAYQVMLDAAQKIKTGERFEEIARQINDDGSGPEGGVIQGLTEDQMSPLIQEQIKKLKIGQVSDIFESQPPGRYYLLKLKDIESTEKSHFEASQDEIRARLTTEAIQDQISRWSEREMQKAFIHQVGKPSVAPIHLHHPH